MELLDELVHVLQDVVLFFTCVVRGRPSLALAHAHGASGGVEPDAYLPAQPSQRKACLLWLCHAVASDDRSPQA